MTIRLSISCWLMRQLYTLTPWTFSIVVLHCLILNFFYFYFLAKSNFFIFYFLSSPLLYTFLTKSWGGGCRPAQSLPGATGGRGRRLALRLPVNRP
jgi:hypothetical protein